MKHTLNKHPIGIAMNTLETLLKLNEILLEEMPHFAEQANSFQKNASEQRKLLRSLMNVRPPRPISHEFILLQDELLQEEALEKGVIGIAEMQVSLRHPKVYLWQGDITRLSVDGIVNAANSALLGCFNPCHACIDNVIHSAAGLQLRNECHSIMQKQGYDEKTGMAKITKAYNLPSAYVIHTVGPIIQDTPSKKDCELLQKCYESCFHLAVENKLTSIAFCCISTGEFRFPNALAAEIAIDAVLGLLQQTDSNMKVVFNVFKEIDHDIYTKLLG